MDLKIQESRLYTKPSIPFRHIVNGHNDIYNPKSLNHLKEASNVMSQWTLRMRRKKDAMIPQLSKFLIRVIL